jgi:hypothetical protein
LHETSPTSGGRSVGIVRLRTKITELVSCFIYLRAELNSQWPITESARIQINETTQVKTNKNKEKAIS